MKIWAISDIHEKYGYLDIPSGIDMMIVAGDLGTVREPAENMNVVMGVIEWIESLPIQKKVWIAGNHDTSIYYHHVRPKELNIESTYIEHETVEINGLKIFGSPYTVTFGNNWGFNVKREKIDEYWKEIPEDIDILITHGPPLGIMDHVSPYTSIKDEYGNSAVYSCGDKALLRHVLRVKPKIHIFGHIHPEERCFNKGIFEYEGIRFINACVLDLKLNYNNNGVTFEL